MLVVDQRLCPCGSGLRRARCCDLNLASLGPPEASRHLLPLVERAREAVREGMNEAAEKLCLEVLELAPGQLEALALLFELRRAQGVHAAAEALLRRIVGINPNIFWATNELTLLLLNRGSLAEAELHARNAVRIAPENPQSHNLMGMVLTEGNRPRIGEYHYRRVLELTETPDPILLANLAWNLKNQGRMAQARALYEHSVALAPDVLQTVLGWARLEEADRNFPAAAELLDRAERIAPGNESVLLARAVLHGRMRDYDRAFAVLDGMAAKTGLGPNELLEKGRLLDQIGRYDEAWAAFVEGKRRARELTGKSYMAEFAEQQVRRLRGFFTAGRLRTLPRAAVQAGTPQPIFVLGFPRSGTTLVEQTLTAHPRIAAGDELPFINELADVMPRLLASPLTYPEALAELWMGDRREGLDTLRDYYLQRVRQLGILEEGNGWFTDKMPLNEMHLGLIALIFPSAPLIHVLRHPLDVVLSVFSNHLTHGFYCSYELESAARHYVLIADLVESYRTEMSLRYLPIRYEDIIDDQEGSVRRMLRFIGEEFDPRCLHFHENRRYARTASYAQVTERLYDRSRFRYRNYLAHLEPVIEMLKPSIERLGYDLS
ncbi:MAG: sulfotransferase [Acidisphaera sp.]|nr:sulfotransferase [Acidisphaera sp.]